MEGGVGIGKDGQRQGWAERGMDRGMCEYGQCGQREGWTEGLMDRGRDVHTTLSPIPPSIHPSVCMKGRMDRGKGGQREEWTEGRMDRGEN